MFRSIFVLILIAIGGYYALQAPFYALLFYIANAYFRPEEWVWVGFVESLKLSLVSGAYVVLATLFSGQKFVWNGRIAFLWLFLLQTFLSTLLAEHFDYSWNLWTFFLKTIVITYLIVVLATDFPKFRLVMLVMTLALGLEQAKQGWFYLLTAPGWHNANQVPFLGDNNGVAVGMLMLVPIIASAAPNGGEKVGEAPIFLLDRRLSLSCSLYILQGRLSRCYGYGGRVVPTVKPQSPRMARSFCCHHGGFYGPTRRASGIVWILLRPMKRRRTDLPLHDFISGKWPFKWPMQTHYSESDIMVTFHPTKTMIFLGVSMERRKQCTTASLGCLPNWAT